MTFNHGVEGSSPSALTNQKPVSVTDVERQREEEAPTMLVAAPSIPLDTAVKLMQHENLFPEPGMRV